MKEQGYKKGDVVLLNKSPFESTISWEPWIPITLGDKTDSGWFVDCVCPLYSSKLNIWESWIAGYAPEENEANADAIAATSDMVELVQMLDLYLMEKCEGLPATVALIDLRTATDAILKKLDL